jgi:hypothetical protein
MSHLRAVNKRILILGRLTLICAIFLIACESRSMTQDTTGPTIDRIKTSGKSFSKDCVPTSITVTSSIADASGVRRAVLWYRVGADQPYTPVDMTPSGKDYSVTVKALDVPGKGYGVLEFYITAENGAGNQSQSLLDTSVEMLLCVSS